VFLTLPVADTAASRRLYALGARAQKASVHISMHPGAQPPLPSAAVDLALTLPSPYVTGETFAVQAIGPWTQHDVTELPAPDVGATTIDPSPIAYASFTSMVGRDVSAITSADVVVALRYAGSLLTGVFQTQYDQTDGADPVQGTMSAVAASEMLNAAITPSTYQTRFAAVRPAFGGQVINWRVTAAPGFAVGDTNGVRLVAGSADPSSATSVTAMYGNPFESLDWPAVFVIVASASRSYTYTENSISAVTTLNTQLATYAAPSATLDISMPAGLAITITANGTPLVTDGQMVALDTTQPVTFDATFDQPANTYYDLAIYELGIDMTTNAVTRTNKLYAATAGTSTFRVPGDVLTPGKSYFLQYRSFVGGFTGAAGGDAQTFEFPYSIGHVDSAVFTVGAP
jgi:hypothetical protein